MEQEENNDIVDISMFARVLLKGIYGDDNAFLYQTKTPTVLDGLIIVYMEKSNICFYRDRITIKTWGGFRLKIEYADPKFSVEYIRDWLIGRDALVAEWQTLRT